MAFFPELKTRDRIIGGPLTWQYRPNGISPWQDRSEPERCRETVISQCHSGTWPRHANTDGDVGGLLQLERSSETFPIRAKVSSFNARGETCFALMPGVVSDGLGDATLATSALLNAFGAKAVAAVLPTNPNASLATTIGELRQEGLPRLPGASLKDQVALTRKAGSEYLNVEFGWLPLVNDLQAFATSVRKSRQLIDQYVRDSDRKIRRRYTAPRQIESSVQYHNGCIAYGGFSGPGSCTGTLTTDLWFSGAFKYHVPVDSEFMGRLRRYEALSNHLFGTRITPELVWNLAPWSWAVDWFTNAGDVIHNISLLGVDGLVMQYGYAMRHSRKQTEWKMTLPSGAPVMRLNVHEYKERVRANPYGFGIDDTSLNAAQLAILAALGLTKGKRNQ